MSVKHQKQEVYQKNHEFSLRSFWVNYFKEQYLRFLKLNSSLKIVEDSEQYLRLLLKQCVCLL